MTGPKFRNYWPLSYVIWVLIMSGKGRCVSYSTGKNGIFLSETITQKTSLTPAKCFPRHSKRRLCLKS